MGWSAWQSVSCGDSEFTEITYKKKFHDELLGGVARIAFNRQHRYNAFTDVTQDEIFRALYNANQDPMIGVVLLTGEGDHFCVGGDVEWEKAGLAHTVLGYCPQPAPAR